MKQTFLLLLSISLFASCKEVIKIDEKFIVSKFQENADEINSLEYKIRRIDTFAQGGTVWNNTGVALIEKDTTDEIFGFSFYGKRDDVPNEYIYDAGNAFDISKEDKTYEIRPGNYGFIGSPGGQMIPENVFSLDTVYKKVSLTENDNTYSLKYEFENDTVYNTTDIVKTIEFTKDNFFPIKIKRTSNRLGNKTVSQTVISDIKINESVQNSIEELKSRFKDFTITEREKRQASKLLNKELPAMSLPDLFNQNNIVDLKSDKPTLIDFWEVWCGPCIVSFPKVEELKKKYSSKLNVVGIVSEDIENAKKLVTKKGTTFLNLIGNNELEQKFSVNSWPRYFLVDNKGIIRKEYFGFSEKIENDIKEIIAD